MNFLKSRIKCDMLFVQNVFHWNKIDKLDITDNGEDIKTVVLKIL